MMCLPAMILLLITSACSRGGAEVTGDFYGSPSYNPFIGIKQSLVSNAETPLFAVRIEGDVPVDHIYFSLLTMEAYDGDHFFTSRPEVVQADSRQWQADGHRFAGPVDTVTTDFEIKRLQMEWLPVASTPQDLASTSEITEAVQVRTDDGALRFEGGLTFDGMRYQVASNIPRPDVAALAVGEDGQLSPAFRGAVEAGESVPSVSAVTWREEPDEAEKYLELPEDLDTGIASLAREQTRNLETSFEKAIALESWFRSSAFRYSTDVVPGHGATDLAAWLLDPDSVNYRFGYCEDFAASMAVMARTVGIPSRVVLGFTPGTSQSDGTIIVRDRNAHAWVELWMPTQGWVRFDPTPRDDEVNPAAHEQFAAALGFPIIRYLEVPTP